MLVPRNIHQHLQLALLRQIQKPTGWRVVNADEIGSEFDNSGEIHSGLFRRGKRHPARVRREGAVGDAFYIKFLFAQPEKLSIHHHP